MKQKRIQRRHRKMVTSDQLSCNPDETMDLLISMKNDNQSWQMIADSLSNDALKISPALVRKVALGECKSKKIAMALGIIETEIAVPLQRIKKHLPNPKDKGRNRRCTEFTAKRAHQFDEMLSERGASLTEWMNAELDNWLSVK